MFNWPSGKPKEQQFCLLFNAHAVVLLMPALMGVNVLFSEKFAMVLVESVS